MSFSHVKMATAAALLSVGATAAQASYTLQCQMTDMQASGGYIPRNITVAIDEAAGTATLLGPDTMLALVDNPAGTLDEVSDSRIEAAIQTVTRSNSNQRAQMAFRLTWIKRTNRASIAAIPLGYTNRFIARGACQRT